MQLGLKILGSNFMEAYNFYFNLGEYYFNLVSKNKGVLPAAKACYIIASENLIQINSIIKDEEMIKANKKKLSDLITL
jgi:hypothetical protein